MNCKTISVLSVAFILFFFSSTLSADIIELKSGKIVEGEITEQTEKFIGIETDSGTSFLKMEDVKSVKKTRLDVATGSIAETTGTVEVLPNGKKEWVPAEEGMTLNEGDKVRTGPDSRAFAVFENQVIMAVEPQSSVELERLEQSVKKDIKIKVNLDKGQIWNDVGKLKTKRSKFYVETPQVVTGVRGTVFTVQAGADEKTTVAVVNGEVDVRTRDMMMDPIKVKENQMTEVAANKPPTKPVVISGAILAQWAVLQAQFGLLSGGMGAAGAQVSPAVAAAGGGVAVAGVAAVAAAGDGGGSTEPTPPEPVNVNASETGLFSPSPIDRIIDGSPVIAGRTVVSVEVRMLCDPFTVPDRFQIIYAGNVIGDTGMVGEDLGDPGENILLNGRADGSSPVVIIRVISGPLGTDWHWDARVTYFVE